MKLLIISDLHISNDKHLGIFGWDQEDFLNTIKRIREENKIDKIILNGDTFDLYKSSYEDIELKNRKIIDYLTEINATFIRGNHDNNLKFGQKCFEIINSSGGKIRIEHGHKGDFISSTSIGQLLGNLLYSVLKILANLKLTRSLYFWYMEHDEGLKGHGKYNSYKHLKYALKLLHRYNVVILGHTHKIEAHDSYWLNDKKQYLNSGSCSFGKFQGILLDTESLQYSTIRTGPRMLSEERIYVQTSPDIQSNSVRGVLVPA